MHQMGKKSCDTCTRQTEQKGLHFKLISKLPHHVPFIEVENINICYFIGVVHKLIPRSLEMLFFRPCVVIYLFV